ncbi:MAG TPA: hypothetical protein VGM51_00950 [Armatimonadota bacterium]|jgi:hypothetical protein
MAYTAHSAGKYTEAITAGQAYAKKYPDSAQFEEAAFRIVEDLGAVDRHQEALAYLDVLGTLRPDLKARVDVTRADVYAEGTKEVYESNKLAEQPSPQMPPPGCAELLETIVLFISVGTVRSACAASTGSRAITVAPRDWPDGPFPAQPSDGTNSANNPLNEHQPPRVPKDLGTTATPNPAYTGNLVTDFVPSGPNQGYNYVTNFSPTWDVIAYMNRDLASMISAYSSNQCPPSVLFLEPTI